MSFQNCRITGWGVDSDAYHRIDIQRGQPDFPMSPSALKEFALCPRRWKAGYKSPPSDAKDYGNALDCAILTPKIYGQRYVLEPLHYPAQEHQVKKGVVLGQNLEWSNNAKFCREWKRGHEEAGRRVISQNEYDQIWKAVERFNSDRILAQYVEESDRQVMVCGEWNDEASGLAVPVRCLIDLVPHNDSEFAGTLADLKTIRNASIGAFTRFVYQMGWHVQGAFDLDLYTSATKEDRTTWCFLVQENYAPWETAKRMLSQDFTDLGRSAYRNALALYCRCLKTGKWPGYDDHDEAIQGWSLVSAEPWMGGDSIFAPKIEVEEAEEIPEEEKEIIP